MRARSVGWRVLIPTLLFPALVIEAAEEPSQSIAFYAMGIGIDGEVGIGRLTADIDVSASEIFDHLEFGGMGSYRFDSEPWSFQVDVIYASLAADKVGSRGVARTTVDLDQAMIEVNAGYQVRENLELIFGGRYWDYDTEIALFGSGPAAVVQRTEDTKSWVDPLIGVRLVVPIGSNWRFIGRGDVGGFGVGSDFAWHATGFFDWSLGERFSLVFGYRLFDVDFEDGAGANEFRADLQQSGPGAGISFSF